WRIPRDNCSESTSAPNSWQSLGRGRPHTCNAVASQRFQEEFGFVEFGKKFFFRLKFRSVNAAATATQLDRMFQVEHLVIHDIFHSTPRHANVIEDTADNNCIVRRIVMRETVARMRATPGHLRPGQQTIKELPIECFENFVEVI